MFNLPDIVHFISNTIKDIVRLSVFKPTITVLRGVITKFHKSHLGEAELAIAHTAVGISKGLDAIGKTRFGTIIIASWALQANIPSMKIVVERDNFDLGVRLNYSKPQYHINILLLGICSIFPNNVDIVSIRACSCETDQGRITRTKSAHLPRGK